MSKTISNVGINLIKKYEGCVLFAYADPVGVWTIGYGHTVGVKRGQTITQAQAEAYLKSDLKIYENHVTNTKLNLNQNQFDALVSFTYNCGAGSLSMLIKNRNLSQISNALLLYNKAGGRVLQGLVNRRKSEKELFDKGVPVAPKPAKKFNIPSGNFSKKTHGKVYSVEVLTIQKALSAIYFYPNKGATNNGCDGWYGTNTDNAVKRFQSVYGLIVDGIFGANCRKKLDSLVNK